MAQRKTRAQGRTLILLTTAQWLRCIGDGEWFFFFTLASPMHRRWMGVELFLPFFYFFFCGKGVKKKKKKKKRLSDLATCKWYLPSSSSILFVRIRCFDWGKSRHRSGCWAAPAGASPDQRDGMRRGFFFFFSPFFFFHSIFLSSSPTLYLPVCYIYVVSVGTSFSPTDSDSDWPRLDARVGT
ncbi:hypothetical protein LX32DRAFT_278674 [Colletotrichum zoysiae]|uniref:Uncharacterized protein n=1 Tax=Colletotrichum zoysiae TaxID=1216348 RepID=A0AAD9LUL5_9PEZI|nr:hypothetical protein LX32DRAFT_278674 [Colletotrichum zoysiae]